MIMETQTHHHIQTPTHIERQKKIVAARGAQRRGSGRDIERRTHSHT